MIFLSPGALRPSPPDADDEFLAELLAEAVKPLADELHGFLGGFTVRLPFDITAENACAWSAVFGGRISRTRSRRTTAMNNYWQELPQ